MVQCLLVVLELFELDCYRQRDLLRFGVSRWLYAQHADL